MFCLETREEMPASEEEIEEALAEGVELNTAWGPQKLTVGKKGEVTGITFKKCLRTIDPETKKFSPVYDDNETVEIKADKVVFAIGQSVEWGQTSRWHGRYARTRQLSRRGRLDVSDRRPRYFRRRRRVYRT